VRIAGLLPVKFYKVVFYFKEPTHLAKSIVHTSPKGIANLQINNAQQNFLSKKNDGL
jgi:hypothetical protein